MGQGQACSAEAIDSECATCRHAAVHSAANSWHSAQSSMEATRRKSDRSRVCVGASEPYESQGREEEEEEEEEEKEEKEGGVLPVHIA